MTIPMGTTGENSGFTTEKSARVHVFSSCPIESFKRPGSNGYWFHLYAWMGDPATASAGTCFGQIPKECHASSDPEPYLLINAVCGGERIKQRYDLPCRQDHIWKLDIVLNKKDHLVHGSC